MISTRVVVLVLLIAALSLYAAYSANIVANIQRTSDSIQTISDLMDSPLKIGIHDIVYNRYYFKMLDDPVRKKFYDTKVKDKSNIWMNVTDGIENVRKGLFAFQVETSAGYQVMQDSYAEDEKCGLHEIDILNILNPLLVIKRQSPYRELIRVSALWIHETGLQKRDLHRLYTSKPSCVGQTAFISVGLTECYPAILTIAYGALLTFGVFILELIWHYCNDNYLKNTIPDFDRNSEKSLDEKTPSIVDFDGTSFE